MALSFCMVLCLALTAPRAAAAPRSVVDPEYIIDHWETEDGLPENSATAMAQTADGYLWFGTYKGLVRFDGLRFEVFNTVNTPALTDSGIVNLYLDKAERLWVSTFKGMAVREKGVWRSIGVADGWVGGYVRTFAERPTGGMLVTTFDGAVLEFTDGQFRRLPPPPGDAGAGAMGACDDEGTWWVSKVDRVARWEEGRWTTAAGGAKELRGFLTARSGEGHLWVLQSRLMVKVSKQAVIERRELRGPIGELWSGFEDSRGNLWLCTLGQGMYRLSPDGGCRQWTTENGLSYDTVRFVFEDREGNMWVGTSGGGLMRFRPRRVHSIKALDGRVEPVVRSVSSTAQGGILVGAYADGLIRLSGDARTNIPSAGLGYVHSVLEDRRGREWTGTWTAGLFRTDGPIPQRVPTEFTPGMNITALFEDSAGRVWVGDGHGVSVLDGEVWRVLGPSEGLPPSGVCSFAEDERGRMWVSNLTGVFRLENDRFEEVKSPGGAPIADITCFKTEAGGTVWMGSRTTGLLRWREGRLDRVESRLGRAGSSISGILADHSGIWWLATNYGIIRVSRAQLDNVADGRAASADFLLLGIEDGMATIECTSERQPVCTTDTRGRLWFATVKGVAMIDPATFRLNTVAPPVRIDSIAYARPSSRGDSASEEGFGFKVAALADPDLRLPPGCRRLEFKYTALSFTDPAKVRFEYQLEGRDEAWVDGGHQRSAVYTDVPPGEYRFRVRACNNDGLWNTESASLTLAVAPFYWQTWWFKSVVGIGLVGSGSLVAWWATNARHRERFKVKERFRLVIESAPNGMIAVNAAGRIVLVNAQTERSFAYDRSDLIGQPITLLLPGLLDISAAASGDGVHANGTSSGKHQREMTGRRKDGREFPLEVGLNPVSSAEGPLTMASIVDISERKRSQVELERQRLEVTHLSRVTMLGELSGSLAHELNQPLTAILSNAQAAQRFLALEKVDLLEVRDILGDIVEQNKRAGEVIHRLRVLLKKGEIELVPLDIGEVVRDVLKLVGSDLINHGVTVRADIQPQLPMVHGDRVHLQQVLVNLVINGCDAMTANLPGNRKLGVKAQVDGTKGVRVSVSDSGTGIAVENLDTVFQPFFTTKTTGMGLGLAVCRTIVTAHGGELWAANNEGRGAVFHLVLPLYSGAHA